MFLVCDGPFMKINAEITVAGVDFSVTQAGVGPWMPPGESECHERRRMEASAADGRPMPTGNPDRPERWGVRVPLRPRFPHTELLSRCVFPFGFPPDGARTCVVCVQNDS